MNQKEIRQCKIHQRIHVLHRRYDRYILFSMTATIIVLTACMGILLRMSHSSGIPTVSAGYGSVLLRNGADIYVLIGITAFIVGVLFTVICIRLRDKGQIKEEKHDVCGNKR